MYTYASESYEGRNVNFGLFTQAVVPHLFY